MSNVIQFLVAMGANPVMNAAEYAASVVTLDADDLQRQALMERDQDTLNKLLGGREQMRCIVWPVERIV